MTEHRIPSTSPKTTPKTEGLYESLLRRILSEEFAAGAKLPPERELALEYGTNRNTLREAVRRLEHACLVRVRQGSGVTVEDFRKTASIDLLGAFLEHGKDAAEKARVALDLLGPRKQMIEQAVRSAVARARAEDLWRLDEATDAAREAENDKDAGALMRAEGVWLEALVDAARSLPMRWAANPILAALGDITERRPEFVVFEPSFADHARALRTHIGARDGEAAVLEVHRFHDLVDQQLRALLEPFAAPVGER